MQEDHLTVDQCDQLAKALREDAARLPSGSDQKNLLQLAESYRILADLKNSDAAEYRRVAAELHATLAEGKDA